MFEADAPTARESGSGGVLAPMLGVVLALAGCTAVGFVGAALWRLRPRPEHAAAGGLDDAPHTWSWVHAEDYAGYRAALVEHFKGATPQLEHEYRIAPWKASRPYRCTVSVSNLSPRRSAS